MSLSLVAISKLDLEGNLLTTWSQVAEIASQLTLVELRLSKNNISSLESPRASIETKENGIEMKHQAASPSLLLPRELHGFGGCFLHLEALFLNYVPNTWQQAWHCVLRSFFPSLLSLMFVVLPSY